MKPLHEATVMHDRACLPMAVLLLLAAWGLPLWETPSHAHRLFAQTPAAAPTAEAAPAAGTGQPEPGELDEVSRRATQLEAELGKLRDTTPEAAELMLQLVELYHTEGRVLGLVRVGQLFVGKHPDHARHAEVMLKLLDGLVAISRNTEAVAIARQYLNRYPEAAECPAVEVRLAEALDQLASLPDAAAAWEQVWRRQPDTPGGRDAALAAMRRYTAANAGPYFVRAAEIGQALLEAAPAGEFASEVGWQAVELFRRAGEYARSNIAAAALLAKCPPQAPADLAYLHQTMASNYAALGQHTNAVVSWRQARAAVDSEYAHRMLIGAMHAASARPEEMEPVVAEYLARYPQAPERLGLRSLLAHAYLRVAEQAARGVALLAELLPEDAVTNSNAQVYLNHVGSEPAQLAQAEQVLLAALERNPRHAAYLRYVLAFSLYRDRLKDPARCRQMLRELVSRSPTNDYLTYEATSWLLYNAADDGEFQAELARAVQARGERPHWAYHRNILPNWAKEAAGNPMFQARAAAVQAALANDPQAEAYAVWQAAESQDMATAIAARTRLLAGALNDEQFQLAAGAQAWTYRHYGSPDQRAHSVALYGQLVQRFPQDWQYAANWLETATDYGTPEQAQAAARHVLGLVPTGNQPSIWYRLMVAADRAQEAALVRQAYEWIQRSQQQFGPDNSYADSIGDVLEKYQMAAEALEYWRRAVAVNRNSYYSRSCAERVLRRLAEAERAAYIQQLLAADSDYHGTYAMWLAGEAINWAEGRKPDLDTWERILRASRERQDQRPFRPWGMEEYPLQTWLDYYRNQAQVAEAERRRVFTVIRDMRLGRVSAAAQLALLELPGTEPSAPLDRLLAYQRATQLFEDNYADWDRLFPFAQALVSRQDYVAAATLLSGMLANIPNIDAGRQQAGRDLLALCYSRLGTVGLAIDESSPIAPLMQAALYLRLGDQRLALDTYLAHQALFDRHRLELPVDLILFVCETHLAAGGDANFDRVEDILRGWLVAMGDRPEVEARDKARVQLLLAKNYFRAQRYDVARSEYTTVINRFPGTPEALEAEFGIGESFMAQKVYDQAELAFERLAESQDRDTAVRAEFLRGVLASRRGELDEARRIFRAVLERVPSVELANQALFNLAEVYGAEQRYLEQLELLRTVGRLGRTSQRWHAPGTSLSIVVQDSDLGVSRGHSRIPVLVTTEPGGDRELIYLTSGGAGKGLFRADLETRLGSATPGDKVLQLTGNDVIRCDYPPEFKAEFHSVAQPDSEIRVAADGILEAASARIIDREQETFTQRLQREEQERAQQDRRRSQGRPAQQVKPGNLIYLRVKDPDRDLTDSADQILVKLTASSGDQVQVRLQETEPHSGVFQGTAQTAELPAGALASDTAIDHSPLMAIDRDPQTYWISQPDGATPKWISVDLKDLRLVDRVTVRSPDASRHVPVRGALQGSQDGRFWFPLGRNPATPQAAPVAEAYGQMTQRVYAGNHVHFADWKQVAELARNFPPLSEEPVNTLAWSIPPEVDQERSSQAHSVIWHGKFVQPRNGVVRFAVEGTTTALAMDGRLELALGPGGRHVDLWLSAGTHDLAVFAAVQTAAQGASLRLARADFDRSEVALVPFRMADFDLSDPVARPALVREPAELTLAEGVWDFRFEPIELRHVRLWVDEYLGEALAVSHFEISGESGAEQYIPTEADVLSLASNDVLEIAAGDLITAAYTDEYSLAAGGRSQLLTAQLQATYFDARVQAIAYDFVRLESGEVVNIRKELKRIDPGDRVVVEVVDYDMDTTDQPDTVRLQVSVNDGEPIELVAQETEPYSGIFTKEVDTSSQPEPGKLTVKRGDRIYCTYVDGQNTFPGHAVPREAVVYVAEPSEGRVRIVPSRTVRRDKQADAPLEWVYLPPTADEGRRAVGVAFAAPLTVEVIDRDAARDSHSKVTVQLTTTDGAQVEVECLISDAYLGASLLGEAADPLEEGRFLGQVIMQLGGGRSPSLVPRTAAMPVGLVGGPRLTEEDRASGGETVVTRVLNVTGKDIISAVYRDASRPAGKPQDLRARGRLITTGTLACTDREYRRSVETLHVGERLFLLVHDPDRDQSDERDRCQVQVVSPRGERETVELEETLAHSGVFAGSLALLAAEVPQPGNLDAGNPGVETWFGDALELRYLDPAADTESGRAEVSLVVPVVVGTDGVVAAFSKVFADESLAVETQFHIAESYFELFKSHKKLGRAEEERADLEAGRRVLRELMEDYPNPRYTPRVAYLLGQFAQELGQWDEAIASYRLIVQQFPDHSLAADAQYKLAQCYEEAQDLAAALEAYVTLAATYPNSPLVAHVMVRISDRFYKDENYEVAAQVGERFLEKFEGHQWAPKMAFRVGQCYYKAKQFARAAGAFDKFSKEFPDDVLCADALFWAGESYRLAGNNRDAFRRYNRCQWDFPSSDAAKYARGRLALPSMLALFESEANAVEEELEKQQ